MEILENANIIKASLTDEVKMLRDALTDYTESIELTHGRNSLGEYWGFKTVFTRGTHI